MAPSARRVVEGADPYNGKTGIPVILSERSESKDLAAKPHIAPGLQGFLAVIRMTGKRIATPVCATPRNDRYYYGDRRGRTFCAADTCPGVQNPYGQDVKNSMAFFVNNAESASNHPGKG